jgi:PAS domain S-box-containing protein
VAKIGIFEWNIQTGVNAWTPELEAMYGLQPGEFGKTQTAWEQLVHPDDRSEAVSLVEHAFQTGEPVEGDWRVIWPNGSVHWLTGRCQVFKDATGQPLRMTGVNIDITKRKQAEKDLAKQSKLLDLSYDAILIRDADDRISYWSTGAREVYGYTKEEALGKSSHELLQTRFPLPFEKIYEILFREGRWTGELIHTRKDGKKITVITRWILDRDDLGNLNSILETNNDITELKRTEETLNKAYEQIKTQSEELQAQNEELQAQSEESQEANEFLRDSEERYRMLFTNMTEGFGLLEIIYNNEGRPSDYRYLEINPVFERYLGVNRGQLLGKSMRDTFPKLSPIAIDKYNEVALSGQPIHFEIFSEIANKYLDINAFVPEKGKLALILRDITERKAAEAKLKDTLDNLDNLVKERTVELEETYNSLKRSEAKYRNIVETANEGILITDNESKATYLNKRLADMLRYTPQELMGKSTWDLISEEYKPVVKLNLDNRRQGISNSYELKLIRKDGYLIWTIINAKPLFGDDGKYIGAMSMFTDITERKEAEETLAKIEITRKKEIHHRIKNNLQVISSLLDLQAEHFRNKKCIKNSEVLEAFRNSQDRVISMALIHEELYKGGGFETLNFSQYMEELAENLFQTYGIGNKGISLKLDLAENAFFDIDIAVPLGIIVNELVSNSFKHAFADINNGEIQIKLSREKNGEFIDENSESTSFVLTVSDNGIGIPKDLDIENLDTLGMQLVTSLVDQLDGELELKRDKGAEFIIRFTI